MDRQGIEDTSRERRHTRTGGCDGATGNSRTGDERSHGHRQPDDGEATEDQPTGRIRHASGQEKRDYPTVQRFASSEIPPENRLWGEDWPEVRRRWALDPLLAHLNHGSFGAVPLPVREAQDRFRNEAEANPNAFFGRNLAERAERARVAAAAFLRAEPGGFAFVRNATTGVNTVLSSIDLRPGDQVLVTDHAYGAVRLAAERACRRAGAELIVQPVPLDEGDPILDAVLSGLTPRTRLAVVDHVASPTAVVFPVADLVAALRSRGVLALVDAAHSPGMVDVDLEALDPDFWTGNFHKWCCAPRGAAGLFVREEHRDRLAPLVASWDVRKGFPTSFGWLGTDDYSAYLAVPAAIDFLGELGWDRLRDHNRTLARHARRTVAEAIGAEELELGEAMTLVPMPDGVGADEEAARDLTERIAAELRCEVAVTVWRGRGFVRLSAQAYNAPSEYERLGAGLRDLLGR
jgi:isopenicillin-N epimerase